MARLGYSGKWGGWSVAVVVLLTLTFVSPSSATLKYGPVQLSGSFDSQNLVRYTDGDFQFIQNRNTALLRFEWEWLKKGTFIESIDVPFIKSSNLFILYRGVYDGFYDIAPGGLQRGVSRADDIVGGPIVGNFITGDLSVACLDPVTDPRCSGNIQRDPNGQPILQPGVGGIPQPVLKDGKYSRLNEGARESSKFENELREAYVDLKFRDLPLSLRLGRQQVIWGESDQFRLMDIWNPLDLTWHLQQEEWDKIRIPLWLIKGIWDTGRVGPLSNTFVEFVWNPGDFQPGVKIEFLPYPWSVEVPNPVREGQVQAASAQNAILLSPTFDLQGTSFKHGDFKRNPEDASDFGIRFHGVTPQGVEFTTNYLYIRGRGIGAKAGSPFNLSFDQILVPSTSLASNAIQDPATGGPALFANTPVFPAFVKARINHPYVHVFGLTGNYFEGNFTNAVLRMETAYAIDEPYQTRDNRLRVTEVRADGSICDPDTESCLEVRAPIAATKRDVWAGMIGFDRPTWIRWLNRKTTWFLTGQFFWSYVNGKVAGLRDGVITASESPYFTPAPGTPFSGTLKNNGGFGTWQSGPYAGQVERIQDASFESDISNVVRRWELLATLAGLSFYRGGTVVPFFALAYDPVNSNWLTQLRVDWFLTNNLIVQPQAKFFGDSFFGARFGKGQHLDPWGAGGLNHRRDELGVKITWQF
jgi:hypothetical protein